MEITGIHGNHSRMISVVITGLAVNASDLIDSFYKDNT